MPFILLLYTDFLTINEIAYKWTQYVYTDMHTVDDAVSHYIVHIPSLKFIYLPQTKRALNTFKGYFIFPLDLHYVSPFTRLTRGI